MKRLFTLLIAGAFPVLSLFAQTVPMKVVGDMVIGADGTLRSDGAVIVAANSTTEYGKIHVKENGTLNIQKELLFMSNANSDGLLLNEGSVEFADVAKIKVVKEFYHLKRDLDKGEGTFHPVSFPFKVTLANVKNENEKSAFESDFWVQNYDPKRRADLGTYIGNWDYTFKRNPVPTELNAGEMYMITLDDKYGENDKVKIVFESDDHLHGVYASQDKEVALTYSYNSSSDATHWGWNVIGAQQTSNFILNNNDMGDFTLAGPDDYEYTGPVYYFSEVKNSWTALAPGEDFIQVPYSGLFVQFGEAQLGGPGINGDTYSIKFKSSGRTLYDTRMVARAMTYDASSASKRIKVSLSTDNGTDNSWIIVNEKYKKGYFSGEDAIKFSSTCQSEIYSIVDENVGLAINYMPSLRNDEEIPLGVSLKENAEYTISLADILDNENQFGSVLLEDKYLNQVKNLKEGDYHFSSQPTELKDRFVLRLIQDMTDIIDVDNASILIYANKGRIYIENVEQGDFIQIYDISGALLNTDYASSDKVSYPFSEKGIYLVKVSGAKASSTAKVIMK